MEPQYLQSSLKSESKVIPEYPSDPSPPSKWPHSTPKVTPKVPSKYRLLTKSPPGYTQSDPDIPPKGPTGYPQNYPKVIPVYQQSEPSVPPKFKSLARYISEKSPSHSIHSCIVRIEELCHGEIQSLQKKGSNYNPSKITKTERGLSFCHFCTLELKV